MMKKSLLLTLCLFSGGVSAEEVYKCLQNGQLTISTLPCPPGAVSTVVPVEASPQQPLSPEEELARMKQKADALERERLDREATQAAARATPPLAQPDQATEAVNAHGRLNAARKRREEAAQNPNGGNPGGDGGGNTGAGDTKKTGSISGGR
jgi:hypothetical protein